MSLPDIKIYDGKRWKKFFYHDTRKGEKFLNYNEAINSSTNTKYSILYQLGENYRNTKTGYFEFLLEYPGFEGSNEWKQVVNPLNSTNKMRSDSLSYVKTKLSWEENYFGGIKKSKLSDSAFECSDGSDKWWYAIGAYSWHEKTNYIPGFNTQLVQQVVFYVMIPDYNNQMYSCVKKRKILKHLCFILFLC